jgi:carbon monoxide dehydrogenase subunit G
MKIEEKFHVGRPPEAVFAYMTDAPEESPQAVEFAGFEPGRVFAARVVEGSMPVDGRWTLADDGAGGTEVTFVAEGPIGGPTKLVEPLIRRGIARSFRGYHRLLAEQVEAMPPRG